MDLVNGTRPPIGAHNTPAPQQAFEYAGGHRDLTIHDGLYLSVDRVPSPGHIPTLRRQSTKQLIHRFESMTNAAEMAQVKNPPGFTHTFSETDSHDMHRPSLTVAPHKSKRRSLSNSLRNFMSVFKKKKDKESDDDDYLPPSHIAEHSIAVLGERGFLPESWMISRPPEKDISSSLDGAGLHLSGSLLYLSRPSSHSPVWISCTVALYSSHLLVTWYTMHDALSSHTIQLDGFMDVHSLNERVLRPDTEGDLKTFELSFEGRPRETFAAPSMQDRARWVGAIW